MSTKFLRIQPDGFMELRDLDRERDLLDVIHDELDGGFFEIVRCRTLPRKFVMLVDDCGVIKDLPINPVASVLYTNAIAGTALIMKEDYDDGEPDLFGLDEDDTAELFKKLHGLIVITEVE